MTDERNILLLSTSTVHGSGFLEYCRDEIGRHFGGRRELLFVPFARPGGMSDDAYTALVDSALQPLDVRVRGIHEVEDAGMALRSAEGVFVGGGNTFLLLRELYARGLLEPIRERVEGGMPYMGSSAGSNVAGLTIGTTNDMPIVYPPSFDALGLVPFNLNPHYIDPDPDSTHMGETRETRIREFHVQNPQPVLGLREGAWIRSAGRDLLVEGSTGGRLFRQGDEPLEIAPGSVLPRPVQA